MRPATLDNLVARLEYERLPAIDIVHFDGQTAALGETPALLILDNLESLQQKAL
ncbi:hypothetical protein [Calothrix sp. NIES-2098]|uniref:hypothetical protein n=1 Tax=Calothrix sp. NIES-2098 TaxID=1954171 RepID=UPI000B5F5648|nr:hypothetical protein NIES2098_47190 [Calothrix sp. NIES-2098]